MHIEFDIFYLSFFLKGNEMETIFIDYLFNKNFFVAQNKEHSFQPEIWITLAKKFNINVTGDIHCLETDMIEAANRNLGYRVPEPFYRGFPDTVKSLTPSELLYDQIFSYLTTYGLGDFSEARHSIFETQIKRKVFDEEAEIKEFTIIIEEEAIEKISEYVDQLLSGTRQLSAEQYMIVQYYLKFYNKIPDHCASKNTALRLISDLHDPKLYKFIDLYDIPKLAEQLNWYSRKFNHRYNAKKLNLTNPDRKLITKIMDNMFQDFVNKYDSEFIVRQYLQCFEQKDRWAGLLHHIHYKPKFSIAKQFLEYMRGKKNYSIMSSFEKIMSRVHAEGTGFTAVVAAKYLLKEKGQGALLRNLDYIISRCWDDSEIDQVVSLIDTKNVILLYQLMQHYSIEQPEKRIFKWINHEMMNVHYEGPDENPNRKTRLGQRERMFVMSAIDRQIRKLLKDRLGKVYISPKMKNIALPIQEGASTGGYGTLTRGSRIRIPEGKKVRAFTYWEKVNDIDLSVIGLGADDKQTEFSWRSMWGRQSNAICYSGDQTAGYGGGSEYFDVDIDAFREMYPDIHYLVFCNNIYSYECDSYKNCECRAGFMLRDKIDSGEVFEPKTVKSSFKIDCDSRFAYLFAIDLKARDFIWLNIDKNSQTRVAGTTRMDFLTQYFYILETMNVYDFFAMQARELVLTPSSADIIVADEDDEFSDYLAMNKKLEVIHSYDTERIIQLMNL